MEGRAEDQIVLPGRRLWALAMSPRLVEAYYVHCGSSFDWALEALALALPLVRRQAQGGCWLCLGRGSGQQQAVAAVSSSVAFKAS